MTLAQERKLSMYLGLEEFWDDNAVDTASVPALGPHKTYFLGQLADLQVLASRQEIDIRGHAQNKATLRHLLETLTLNIGGRVAAFAADSDNDILLNEVNYTETELLHAADTEMVSKATIVKERANTNIASLSTFGVDATMVTDLGDAITDFNTILSSPKIAIDIKKEVTSEIKEKFQNMDNRLKNKIDILTNAMRFTIPAYVDAYNNARKIDNPAYRKVSIINRIIDSVTHQGLEGATIVITKRTEGGEPVPPVTVRTGNKGYSRVKNLTEGVYDLEITRPGYTTKTLSTAVIDGRTSHINETLVSNI